jgi:thioredoxin-dependent peroxiredoxin
MKPSEKQTPFVSVLLSDLKPTPPVSPWLFFSKASGALTILAGLAGAVISAVESVQLMGSLVLPTLGVTLLLLGGAGLSSIPGRMEARPACFVGAVLSFLIAALNFIFLSKVFLFSPFSLIVSFSLFLALLVTNISLLVPLFPYDLKNAKGLVVCASLMGATLPTVALGVTDAFSYVLALLGFGGVGILLFPKIYFAASCRKLKEQTRLADTVFLQRPLLKKGALVPAFVLSTVDGREITLEDFRGKKIWLILYRYASCPLCLLHFKGLQEKIAALSKNGIETIAVFESMPSRFPKTSLVDLPGVTVAADPGKAVYHLLGAQNKITALFHSQVICTFFRAQMKGFFQGQIDGEMGQIPAHFLIGPDLKVWESYSGKSIADHIPWQLVEKFQSAR